MRREWIIALLLACVTLAVFWRTSGHDFVGYDDPDYVTANPHVRNGVTSEGLAHAFGQLHGHGVGTYWHPLSSVSHMVDCQLFGLRPGAHHLVNVFWHLLNTLLVFFVLNRMTGAMWRSAAVAALFALHPLQVDTVAWVTERKNLLSTFFGLLTLWAYVRYAERPSRWRYTAALGLLALGLMAKPSLVALPGVLLLLDFWPLRRLKREKTVAAQPAPGPVFAPASLGRLVLEKLPFCVLAGISSWITILSARGLGMEQSAHGLPLWARLANAAVSYARYLKKVVWPDDLCVLYPHPGRWPDLIVLGSILLLLAITGVALVAWRRRPYLAVGWFWFLGVLVPTIGLFQAGVQAMGDRFAYLPLVGLFMALVWGVAEARDGAQWRRVCAGLGVAAGVGCVVGTSLQLRYWQDNLTLFERAVQVTRNNYIAHNNLASSLTDSNRLEEAAFHLHEALRIKPDFATAHYQMGGVLDRQQKPLEAMDAYKRAAQYRPGWPAPERERARLLARVGRMDEAIAAHLAWLASAPPDPAGHVEVATLLSGSQRVRETIQHYQEALRLAPDAVVALNNLAWLRATHPQAEFRDGAEAVRLAERACSLTERQHAQFVGTLAAAYAETGRFAEAQKAAQEAHDLAAKAGEQPLAQTNLRLLELYQAGKPYREAAAAEQTAPRPTPPSSERP